MMLLEYMACCLSNLQFSEAPPIWEGNLKKGRYYRTNGSGDDYGAAWDGDRLVVLVFDHENGARSPYAMGVNPWKDKDEDLLFRRWLGDLPPELEPLYAQAKQHLLCITAAFWSVDGRIVPGADPAFGGANWLGWTFHQHLLDPHEAMHGGFQSWTELQSISKEQGDLAIHLTEMALSPPYHMTAEDRAQALALELADYFPLEDLEGTIQLLAKAGIIWE